MACAAERDNVLAEHHFAQDVGGDGHGVFVMSAADALDSVEGHQRDFRVDAHEYAALFLLEDCPSDIEFGDDLDTRRGVGRVRGGCRDVVLSVLFEDASFGSCILGVVAGYADAGGPRDGLACPGDEELAAKIPDFGFVLYIAALDGELAFGMFVAELEGEIEAGQLGGNGAAHRGSGFGTLDGLFGAGVIVIDIAPLFADGSLQEHAETAHGKARRYEGEVLAVVEGEEVGDVLAEGDDAFFVDGFKIGEIAVDHLVRHCHLAGDGSGCGLVSHEVVGVAVQYLVERAFDFGGCFDGLRGVGSCCRDCGNYAGCRCCRVRLYGGAVGLDGRVGCSGDGGRLGCVGGRGRRGIGHDASGYGLGVGGGGIRYRGFDGGCAGCRVRARLGRCCGVGWLCC